MADHHLSQCGLHICRDRVSKERKSLPSISCRLRHLVCLHTEYGKVPEIRLVVVVVGHDEVRGGFVALDCIGEGVRIKYGATMGDSENEASGVLVLELLKDVLRKSSGCSSTLSSLLKGDKGQRAVASKGVRWFSNSASSSLQSLVLVPQSLCPHYVYVFYQELHTL